MQDEMKRNKTRQNRTRPKTKRKENDAIGGKENLERVGHNKEHFIVLCVYLDDAGGGKERKKGTNR